jgi:HEAT repeat protein
MHRVTDPIHERLRAILREDSVPEVRTEAARALGVTGELRESIEPLIAALDDSSAVVRRAATLALGRIPDRGAVDALVEALATAGDRDLLDRLVPLLDSESSHVRCGAVRAIAAVSSSGAASEAVPVFEYTDDEGHRHPLF